MRRPLSKKDNMLTSSEVLICAKTSEKVHSYSFILNLRRNKYYTVMYFAEATLEHTALLRYQDLKMDFILSK